MNEEERYIKKRIHKAKLQSILFYLFRILPIQKKKIVFCCIEGSTGYSCNPKYIAEEFIRRMKNGCKKEYEMVWLVNDISKHFPKEIKPVKNTLINRAYHLSTAKIWIDNSRKQLEVRKRKGQIYIQTWHAKLGFKPTCLDRGKSFSKIAYLVSKHDSDMIDYVLSNSKWYDDTLPTGMIYNGPTLRFGSPRCDILIKRNNRLYMELRKKYELSEAVKFIMYAPTFRGGSQKTDREVTIDEGSLDYDRLLCALKDRFGGDWYVLLRLHPQLVAQHMKRNIENDRIIDISKEDDMYEILAGCDAFITDYSSAAFDAAVMRIPVFLYCYDYKDYQKERGSLLWELEKLPFLLAQDNDGLQSGIEGFDDTKYQEKLSKLFIDTQMVEDGKASERIVDFIRSI